MKFLPALCLALATLLTVGCSADPEDRAFFGTGWTHPEQAANRRLQNPQSMTEIKNDYDAPPMKAIDQ